MGQFKPMVKMETTEPSVVLKLKKGGHVNMKTGGNVESGHSKMAKGGAMGMLASTPAFVGRPAVNAPVKSPGKPSMAMRRKAMASKPAMPTKLEMPAPIMKEGGKAEKHDDAAQDRAMIKKAMAGKKFATGGVAKGQGGYKAGGIIPAEKDNSKIVTASKTTKARTAKTDPGYERYATGGVANSNAGGYKKGGATKKHFAAGGEVNSGKPVAMPQGDKKPAPPVSINQLSGVYKKGGTARK